MFGLVFGLQRKSMRILFLSLLIFSSLTFAMELDPEKGGERKATLSDRITKQFESLTENSSEKKYTAKNLRTSFWTGYWSGLCVGKCLGCSMLCGFVLGSVGASIALSKLE
jgi:hypothetical protein